MTTFEYDLAGRETAMVDALGDRTEYRYDADNNLVSVTDPLGHKTSYVYDKDNRKVETIYADGSTAAYQYDMDGRLIAETDQAGQTTNYEYDSSGDLTEVILPAVPDPSKGGMMTRPTYQYQYDLYGNETLIIDPDGHETNFTYTQFDLQASRTLPGGQVQQTEYDQYGRPTLTVDFDGQVEEFVYDDLNRLSEEEFFDSMAQETAGTPSETIAITMNDLGETTAISDSLYGTTTYGFDAEGHTDLTTTPSGSIATTYDPATGLIDEISSANTDLQYHYDALGRLSEVDVTKLDGHALATPEATTYSYTATGNMKEILRPTAPRRPIPTISSTGSAPRPTMPPTAPCSTSTSTPWTPTVAASARSRRRSNPTARWRRHAWPGPTTRSAASSRRNRPTSAAPAPLSITMRPTPMTSTVIG